MKDQEYDDLEEKFQISTEVTFSSSPDFEGLQSFESTVKKKKPQQKIKEIELRRPKHKPNPELF